jgi:uncharacterized membrane-anchored protein YitT (DUF2179 family)
MYFWKIDKLKDHIKKGKLSEKDKFIYAFIYITITTIFVELISYLPVPFEQRNVWDVIDSISYVLIVIFGTLFAFRANGGSNGIDFLGKYFSISFVLGIRFLALLAPIAIMLFFYYLFAFGEEEIITSTPFDTLPFNILLGLLYWRTYIHISDVKNSVKPSDTETH